MNYKLPETITDKDELFKYLKENKSFIYQQKKSTVKRGDAISADIPTVDAEQYATKDVAVTAPPTGKLMAKVVINTTNFMDSHDDVHIPGLWKKSLNEAKSHLHLQEHEMEFEKVISDTVTATAKTMTWKSLGFDFEGSTQALIFDSEIDPERNPYMYEQYKKGYVKNHSVGMQYVKMEMCINSKEKYYAEEKAAWDKYYPMIANSSKADECGYFFAVTEARIIEGSAVVRGSNIATPTISVTEAVDDTSKDEPDNTTHVDYVKLKSINFFTNN